MLLKCCSQYISKFGKFISGHRTGEGQFSFQSWRRAVPKNVQTTAQLCSFHMLARLCSKSFKLGFSNKWTENFQDVQAGFRKGRGTRDQIANICWIIEKAKEFQKNIYFIDYARAFDCVDHNKLWKIHQTTLPTSWETCMQVRKQQLKLNINNWLVQNWERNSSRLYIVTLFI